MRFRTDSELFGALGVQSKTDIVMKVGGLFAIFGNPMNVDVKDVF